MIRSTLVVTEDKVSADYECINPLCNNIIRIVLYDKDRDSWLKDWQQDISDQYCPPIERF